MKINYSATNIYALSSNSKIAAKFIEYCLGLSNYFYLGEAQSYYSLQKNINNYDYRSNFCKIRLPREDGFNHFVGVNSLFPLSNEGIAEHFWDNAIVPLEEPPEEFALLSNSNIKFCIRTRFESWGLVRFRTVWPNANFIRIFNTENYFTDNEDHSAVHDSQCWDRMNVHFFDFDSISNKEAFEKEMWKLYDFVGALDFAELGKSRGYAYLNEYRNLFLRSIKNYWI